jgi:MFS family permease
MGGYLNQHLGWRTAFFVLGIPGIVFSLIFYTTVKEPKRGATDIGLAAANKPNSLGRTIQFLFSTKTFVFLAMATGLHVFCLYGVSNWAPSFLARLHGMKSSQIGFSLGLLFGFGGGLGTIAGGFLTDKFGRRDKRWYLKIPAYAILLAVGCEAGALFIQNTSWALFFLGACALLQGLYLGPSIAVAHSLVPAEMRALTSAILFFVLNLVGLGFGPLVVGLISDALAPSLGTESLRWAMSIVLPMSIASALLFFRAAQKLVFDLEELKSEDARQTINVVT